MNPGQATRGYLQPWAGPGAQLGEQTRTIQQFARNEIWPAQGACSWWLTPAVRGSTPSPGLKRGGWGGVRSVRTPFYPFTLVNLDDKGSCLIPLCASEYTEMDNP